MRMAKNTSTATEPMKASLLARLPLPARPASVDLTAHRLETGGVSSLGYLAAVNVVIWVGLFLYLWRLDRRIAERERGR